MFTVQIDLGPETQKLLRDLTAALAGLGSAAPTPAPSRARKSSPAPAPQQTDQAKELSEIEASLGTSVEPLTQNSGGGPIPEKGAPAVSPEAVTVTAAAPMANAPGGSATPQPEVTLEQLRAKAIEKTGSSPERQAMWKEMMARYGCQKISALAPEAYPALYQELEKL